MPEFVARIFFKKISGGIFQLFAQIAPVARIFGPVARIFGPLARICLPEFFDYQIESNSGSNFAGNLSIHFVGIYWSILGTIWWTICGAILVDNLGDLRAKHLVDQFRLQSKVRTKKPASLKPNGLSSKAPVINKNMSSYCATVEMHRRNALRGIQVARYLSRSVWRAACARIFNRLSRQMPWQFAIQSAKKLKNNL